MFLKNLQRDSRKNSSPFFAPNRLSLVSRWLLFNINFYFVVFNFVIIILTFIYSSNFVVFSRCEHLLVFLFHFVLWTCLSFFPSYFPCCASHCRAVESLVFFLFVCLDSRPSFPFISSALITAVGDLRRSWSLYLNIDLRDHGRERKRWMMLLFCSRLQLLQQKRNEETFWKQWRKK